MPHRLPLVLVVLMTTACATGGGVPRPFPGAALPPGAGDAPAEPVPGPAGRADGPPLAPSSGPATSDAGVDVVRTALGYLGAPYRNGGSDPSGFDCSGLVQWVFAHHGTALPREAREQYRVGREIGVREVQPGDLIFFETVSRGASHVGIVIGDGRFVHAPTSGGVVRVEPYTANYWIRRFVGARRVSDVRASAEPDLPGSIRSSR